MYFSFYCKGSKKVSQGFTVRGSWRPTETAIYWPPLLWPSALCLSRSPGLLNRGPGAQLSTGWWLSLLHLISNFSGPQLSRAPRAPSAGLSLPHLISNFSEPQLSDFLSWRSYIIVQRPLNRPLDLWNGMFNRHQAEITVMQFTGHSLPVHHSVAARWDLHLVPYYQPSWPARFLSITGHWDVSLPSGASLWNGMFGRAEGQYITFLSNTNNFITDLFDHRWRGTPYSPDLQSWNLTTRYSLVSYSGHPFRGEFYLSARDTVSIF